MKNNKEKKSIKQIKTIENNQESPSLLAILPKKIKTDMRKQ